MHTVDLSVEVELEAEWLEAVAHRMLDAAGLEEAELSVMLTDDDTIQGMNEEWRGKAEPTDVLSFPQQEPPVEGGMLGDVVISVDTAAAQAVSLGHSLERELVVLLAHGVAHLLGHDHHEPEEAAEMAALEARLLAAVEGGLTGLVVRAGAAG